jgi:chromosome segregation ATPase
VGINEILTGTLVACVGIIGYFSSSTLSDIKSKLQSIQETHNNAITSLREYIDARLRENDVTRRDCQRENDMLFARTDTMKTVENRLSFLESELRSTTLRQERAKGEMEALRQVLGILLTRKRADVCLLPEESQDM